MNSREYWHKRISKAAVLSPVDRISEVLFGLIMVLTFTGAISVSSDGRDEIRDLLWAALGCNVAWGLVDAIMYLMNVLFERGYNSNMLRRMKNTEPGTKSVALLKEEIQPVISELLDDAEAQRLAEKIKLLPDPPTGILLTGRDLMSAVQIFLLVFLCTLPVALPFGFFDDAAFSLRVSNGVALVMLFTGGYQLARHAGFKRFISGFAYMLVGVLLVAITIALGG